MRHATPALLVAACLALAGCRAAPLFDAAVGWAATDALTGPRVQVGLGEYDSAADAPGVLDGLRALEAKAAQAQQEVAALRDQAAAAQAAAAAVDARVQAGALTPEQGAAIKAAAARSEQAVLDAQAAQARLVEQAARASALEARAQALEDAAKRLPSLPTDWTPTGILAALVGVGGWLLRRRAATVARREANAAVAAYDSQPYTHEDVAGLDAARSGKPSA